MPDLPSALRPVKYLSETKVAFEELRTQHMNCRARRRAIRQATNMATFC